MKKSKNVTHLHFSIKKSFVKLLSFAFVAVLVAVISNAVPQKMMTLLSVKQDYYRLQTHKAIVNRANTLFL